MKLFLITRLTMSISSLFSIILNNYFQELPIESIEKILRIGLVGIGFFMLYFSFILIKQKAKTYRIVIFMLFSTIILISSISWKIIDNPNDILKILLEYNNVSVKVETDKSTDSGKLDQNKYYIDSYHEFAYSKPGAGWNRPTVYEGLSGIISLNFGKVDSAEAHQRFLKSVQSSPLYEMILHQTTLVVEKERSRLEITLTDSTTNKWIEYDIENRKQFEIINRGLSIEDPDDAALIEKIIRDYKRSKYLTPHTVSFSNRFVITVFKKEYLPSFLSNMTISDLLRYQLPQLYSVSEIKAEKNSILLNGISSQFQKVLVNGRMNDFNMEKAILLRSTDRFFYMVEISYSPQTDGTSEVLEEMKKMMYDFVTIK